MHHLQTVAFKIIWRSVLELFGVMFQDYLAYTALAWALSRDKCKIPPLRDEVSHLSSQVLDLAFGRPLKSIVATFIICLSEKPKSAPINDSED